MKAKDRKEFERLIAKKFPGWYFQRQLDGGYVATWLDGAWNGWCMRAALESQSDRAAKP
jgi:hypothetical protein